MKPLIDITNMSEQELGKKFGKGVLNRILLGALKARKIESNLEETSHNRHSSGHSKD